VRDYVLLNGIFATKKKKENKLGYGIMWKCCRNKTKENKA